MPGANVAVIVFLSSAMIRVLLPGGQFSGRNPGTRCSRMDREIDRENLHSSASPGSAPSTNTGPVRM